MTLKYLVTGTGRCGTVFLARLLTSAGINCGHEMFFNLDGLDGYLDRLKGFKPKELSLVSTLILNNDMWESIGPWLHGPTDSDSSYLSAPFLDHESLINTKIIHVVRNPIKVINSFVNGLNYFGSNISEYEKNIYKWIPELSEEMSQVDRASLYYILWNEMIEQKLAGKKYLFHRIEDDIQSILDYTECSIPRTKLHSDTETNTFLKKNSKVFKINDISRTFIKSKLVAIGERYGYQMILL